jgi:8-oxo-dGTP pyrophosphatase MutT (NUDIX family)
MTTKDKVIEATLVFMVDEYKVLLATKTRKIGVGRLNGYGGKIESGETVEASAVREVSQECGLVISPENLGKEALITFHNQNKEGVPFIVLVHVFVCRKWEGLPVSSEEMDDPNWYYISRLQQENLMLADYVWLPLVLSGKKIIAEVWYGPNQKTLLSEVKTSEVESI